MKSALKENSEILLRVGGEDLVVKVFHSLKSRSLKIRVTSGGENKLIIPRGKSIQKAHEFLVANSAWLKEKSDNITNIKSQIPDGHLLVFGKLRKINYLESAHTHISLVSEQDELILQCPLHSQKLIITQYLKSIILEKIKKIIEEICITHTFCYERIKLNDSKNNWGTCSNKKVLTFGWRLIFAPYNVIKYVVAHELCHLKEMNHSKKFWELVKSIDPDYLQHRKWLKKNAPLLYPTY